jgi:hypothetical protein
LVALDNSTGKTIKSGRGQRTDIRLPDGGFFDLPLDPVDQSLSVLL